MLRIDKGEEIVDALISSYIAGKEYYKFLSKQKADKTFAWLHFTERVNGNKEKVYTDDVKTKEEIATLIKRMNRNLIKVFGAAAEMKPGKTEIKTIMGIKDDGSIN
jgi:hypothetical protein